MAIIYSYPEVTSLQATDRFIISRFPSGSGEISNYNLDLDTLSSYINTGQATVTQVNDRVVTGASFNTGSGLLTLTRSGGDIPSVTANLDGRYYLSSNPNSYTSNLGVVQSLTTNNSSGAATLIGGVLNIPQYSGGGGGITEITTTAPITGGTITTTGTIGITQASGSADGYLSSTDWNTFNNKVTFPGFGTAAGTALEGNTVIPAAYTDADVDAHLNTSTAGNNEVLSWTGTDYDWVAQSGGGGGDTYDLNAGTKVGISVPLNLTSGSGSDNSLVTLTEGSGVTLTRNSATQITIASSGGGGGATDINGLSDGSTSSNNIALGSTNLNGSFNTITGQLAAQGTYTQGITAFGYRAARYLSTGSQYNVAIGGQALDGFGAIVQNAQQNVAVGNNALSGVISGASYNTAIGANAHSSSNVSGTNMVSIGYNSNPKFKTGSYNICIGTQSGESISPEPVSWSASSHNVFIGARVSGAYTTGNAAIDGLIRIGSYGSSNSAIEMLSHQCVIGNDGTGTGVNDTTTIRPVKNNITDLGTSTAKYKDVYYDGVLQSGTLNSAPSSATDTGTTGEVRFTADYIYVCVATNTWKRTSITTW